MTDQHLADWQQRAQVFEKAINSVVVGLERPVRLITTAVFSRGHVMLEGDVGVGKTTLLRAVARGIGGAYERIEGTIDLMPNDLVYHTYINELGKPQVDPGPILKHGEHLATFFFNEVNRARPQVHSLLLRVMAEKSVTAFNREYYFPHLQVFADRNRVEKDETFEIPSAARDRFMLELRIETPQNSDLQKELMFNPKFYDVDHLIETIDAGILPYRELNGIGKAIQHQIQASGTLQNYALELWQATRDPKAFGISIDNVDMDRLILAGASARGAAMLMRAARVTAWLNNRNHVLPEDIRDIFHEAMAHRIFFNPTYELRRTHIAEQLSKKILQQIAAP
ncbi:AAA family ATPase [Methylicorpusculum sp.]|uniref:AAA family ATPase n=1 Tax=Methylicorpusculum sp. TaxID=2713644 RepID=UPI0027302D75|nr:MoxR family ATPase [Methylicorpusculum sp.]MDP2178507.1 MoxR family ATPase [Methylicorpusculum sp.]MDP3530116.1 MoxR family ATPase [Methylicorpusculum sp.]MDZ4149463.1 MoxR family ATPase [Methylicorpusculum sp.]